MKSAFTAPEVTERIGSGAANAQPTCAQWVVTSFNLQDECDGTIPQHATGGMCTLPAGWHPLGVHS